MITRIKVNNFKSLDDVEICDIPDFLCLIGVNGSGKTTFIELLTFIKALVRGEIGKWTIGGKICELKSLAFAGALRRNFELTVDFELNKSNVYTWDIIFNLYDGQLVREQIVSKCDSIPLIKYESGRIFLRGIESNLVMVPRGSALSLPLKDDKIKEIREALSAFAGVGVLDPVAIADTARLIKGEMDIEENGHKLPAFISQLPADKQEEYRRTICSFYSDFEDINVRGTKFGWKHIVFNELKKTIDALHMSYGTLRYMVMAALKYSSSTLLYFDEVDNGINQEYLGKVVALLKSMPAKQIVITTHNVQLLNNLDDETLRKGVLFFYKNASHRTRVCHFFEIEENAQALEEQSGGAIVSMTDLVDLGNRLAEQENAK